MNRCSCWARSTAPGTRSRTNSAARPRWRHEPARTARPAGCLREGLGEDALDQADSLLDGHDSTLHALLSQPLTAATTPLSALFERQQNLLGLLRQRRDAVAALMNDGQRSLRAAHAYLQAESLA
jgi:hypothetical protein